MNGLYSCKGVASIEATEAIASINLFFFKYLKKIMDKHDTFKL